MKFENMHPWSQKNLIIYINPILLFVQYSSVSFKKMPTIPVLQGNIFFTVHVLTAHSTYKVFCGMRESYSKKMEGGGGGVVMKETKKSVSILKFFKRLKHI